MEIAAASPEEREVLHRVLTGYLPAFCAAQTTEADASAFAPDWSFLTLGLARWFLYAVDDGTVEVRDGDPVLPDASHAALFQKPVGKVGIYREGFFSVAAAGMLAREFGWPPESLTFESPRAEGGSAPWAFDLLAYEDDGKNRRVAIAGEAKWKQRDALKLSKSVADCGSRGGHSKENCSQPADHKKYQGLLDHHPRLFWIFGPTAFLSEPDLVFRVSERSRGVVELQAARAMELVAGSGL